MYAIKRGDYLYRFKDVARRVIPRANGMKTGTHTNCRNFYLQGVWGGGKIAELMYDGRHKTVKHAESYYKDAAGQLVKARANHLNPERMVPQYRATRIEDVSFSHALNAPSRPNQLPMHDLAKRYCEDVIGFGKVTLDSFIPYILS